MFVVRKTLTQMAEEASLTEDKRLMVDGMEVGVIYMRWVISIRISMNQEPCPGAATTLTSTPVRGSGRRG